MTHQSQLPALTFKWLIRANPQLSISNDSSQPTPHLSLSNDSSEPTTSCHFQMTHQSQPPALTFKWLIRANLQLSISNDSSQPTPSCQFQMTHHSQYSPESLLTWPQPIPSRQFCTHFNLTIAEAEWVHSSNPCRCDWIQQIYMRAPSLTSPVRRICAPE